MSGAEYVAPAVGKDVFVTRSVIRLFWSQLRQKVATQHVTYYVMRLLAHGNNCSSDRWTPSCAALATARNIRKRLLVDEPHKRLVPNHGANVGSAM